MWTELTANDMAEAKVCVQIMQKMDRAYASLGPLWVRKLMLLERTRVFLYRDGNSQFALFLQLNQRMGRYRVYTCGFLGPLTPRQALDIGVAKLVDFMKQNNLKEVYGIKRKNLDSDPLNQFFDLVPQHPNLDVKVKHDYPDRTALVVTWK